MKYRNLEDLASDYDRFIMYANKICKNKNLAEELLHQFFEKYIDIVSEQPNKIIHRRYVYRALQNIYLLYKKRNRKFPNIEIELIDDDAIDYNELMKEEALIRKIENEIDKLSYKHQKIFNEKEKLDLSYLEIERRLKKKGLGMNRKDITKAHKATIEHLKKIFNDDENN